MERFGTRTAAEGALFRDVTAPAPTTLASHTSLMTGTWPTTHGVVRNGFEVHEANRMLAEVLSDAGFTTAAFLGSFALEHRFRFDQGFEHFDEEFDLLVRNLITNLHTAWLTTYSMEVRSLEWYRS